MDTIVIYPGRFEPPHKGHKASYDQLKAAFPTAKVLIASSGIVAPITHPFEFSDKVNLFAKLGVPASDIIKSANPNQVPEIKQELSPEEQAHTVLIFAVSAKDQNPTDKDKKPRYPFGIKRNGEPSYMQPLPGNNPENIKKCKPMTEHAYVYVTDVAEFKIKGKTVDSATKIRDMYSKGSDQDREQIIHDLYGTVDPSIEELFDKRLGVAKQVKQAVIQQAPMDNNVLDNPAPVQRESKQHKAKIVKLLESIQTLEARANACYQPFEEDLAPNYICEATGAEYY